MSLSEVLGICAYTQIKSNMSCVDSSPRKMPRTSLLVDGEKKKHCMFFCLIPNLRTVMIKNLADIGFLLLCLVIEAS